jgi:hypothetical protein
VSSKSELPSHDERVIQRLQCKIEVNEVIVGKLGEQISLETNVVTRAQMEIHQRKVEKRLAALQQQLQDAIAKDPRERLRSALIRLDFEDQMRIYRKLTVGKRLGAFLVLPEPPKEAEHIEIAARLLVKRLLLALPDHITTTPLKMSFRRRVKRSDTDALWRELAKLVELPGSAEQQAVVTGVVERLETQHVVILLTDLDRVDLDDCIDRLWIPLANAATEAQSAHSLVLILVDLNGDIQVGTSDVPAPLRIRPLSEDDISLWLRALADDCPFELLEAHETAAQEIIAAASEHNPDGVLEAICARSEWNCPESRLEEWLDV